MESTISMASPVRATEPVTPLRFLDPANLLTFTSLALAASSMWAAMAGQIHWAVIALIGSGFCDLFDGLVARRLKRDRQQQDFGGMLDSLVDACAFGMAPVVLLYASGFSSVYTLPLLLLLAISVVWRLALFSVVDMPERDGRRYFHGLPCTYVALFLPLVYVLALWWPQLMQLGLGGMTVLLIAAMLSTRPIRKPSGVAYVIFAFFAAAAIAVLIWKGANLC